MTTREHIIALARSIAEPETEDPVHNGFVTLTISEFEAFYRAAQREAFERAATLKQEAFEIFTNGQPMWQEQRDIIEWYDASIRVLIEGDK